MEHFLKQNNAIDIYEEYFTGMTSLLTDEPPSARTISILRDPSNPKRTVAHISWYPDGTHKLAAAYSVLEFQKIPDGMSLDSYIWEIGMCYIITYILPCPASQRLLACDVYMCILLYSLNIVISIYANIALNASIGNGMSS